MPPGASLRVFAMYAAGCGRGAPLRGPRRVAFPGATLARHEILVLRFEESPQKIRVHGGEPPCHTRLTPARITETSKAFEGSRRQGGHYSTSKHESSDTGGGRGWGEVPSRDPYLLGRFFEAPNQHLVAGLSGKEEWDSAWSRGGTSPTPARVTGAGELLAELVHDGEAPVF